MQRNRRQARVTKEPRARRSVFKNDVDYFRRYSLRLATIVSITLLFCTAFVLRLQAQEPTRIEIKVTGPGIPIEHKLSEQTPDAPIKIDITGSGQEWKFVRFKKLPESVRLTVQDNTTGYSNSEVIKVDTWYPFKTQLPLTLEVNTQPRNALEISFLFGTPRNRNTAQFFSDKATQDVRDSIERNSNQLQSGEPRTLKLLNPRAAGTVSPSPSPSPSPNTSWISNITTEAAELGFVIPVIALVMLLMIGLIVVWFVIPPIREKVQRWRYQRQQRERTKEKLKSPVDDIDGSQDHNPPSRVVATYPGGQYRENVHASRPEVQRNQEHGTGGFSYEPPQPPIQPDRDGAKLGQLEKRVDEIDQKLDGKVDYDERFTLATVEEMVNQRNREIRLQMATEFTQFYDKDVKPIERLALEQVSGVTEKLEAQTRKLEEFSADNHRIIDQLIAVLKELKTLEGRIHENQKKFAADLERQPIPDSFYAKTLGYVLAQNVEALQDGNFERSMGARLDQFFQTVNRGEGLQEVRARADRIKSAVNAVAAHIEKLNPAAYDGVRHHLQQVEKVVNDLSGMQSQLQERRTVLQIPVSLHAGGRQTLLDGLGRSIKREIEKLEAPEKYFESELERLITADVIAIVDICDKQVAKPPGSHPAIEKALQGLFDAANLCSILPCNGDTFKTAEQDLIHTSQQSGPSLKVAQVVTRGFIYKHSDKDTLLRKAGVIVYR